MTSLSARASFSAASRTDVPASAPYIGGPVDVVQGDLADRPHQRFGFLDDEHEVVVSLLVAIEPRAVLIGRDHVGIEEPAANVVLIAPAERQRQITFFEQAQPDPAPPPTPR
jgi:hypothetical protein